MNHNHSDHTSMDLTDFDPSTDPTQVDVLVIGGGAAGLNGALQLVRQRRSVLVLDAGQPRNAPAHEMHGYLGLDGLNPAELLARGRAEVAGYGGVIRRAVVTGARALTQDETAAPDGVGFQVSTEAGALIRARRLLVTTGVVDALPQVSGLAQRWGRDVVHCPYCHGWEVREQTIVVLATGPAATHQSLLFSQLSDDVTLLLHSAEPDAAQQALLRAAGVRIVAGQAEELLVLDDALTGVRLAGGEVLPAQAVVAASHPEVRAPFLSELGLLTEELGGGMATMVPSGMGGSSSVPGVWLAGNVTEPMAQVGASAAGGAMAGAQINADLVMADAQAKLEGAGDGAGAGGGAA